jgi:hypothetical protein
VSFLLPCHIYPCPLLSNPGLMSSSIRYRLSLSVETRDKSCVIQGLDCQQCVTEGVKTTSWWMTTPPLPRLQLRGNLTSSIWAPCCTHRTVKKTRVWDKASAWISWLVVYPREPDGDRSPRIYWPSDCGELSYKRQGLLQGAGLPGRAHVHDALHKRGAFHNQHARHNSEDITFCSFSIFTDIYGLFILLLSSRWWYRQWRSLKGQAPRHFSPKYILSW